MVNDRTEQRGPAPQQPQGNRQQRSVFRDILVAAAGGVLVLLVTFIGSLLARGVLIERLGGATRAALDDMDTKVTEAISEVKGDYVEQEGKIADISAQIGTIGEKMQVLSPLPSIDSGEAIAAAEIDAWEDFRKHSKIRAISVSFDPPFLKKPAVIAGLTQIEIVEYEQEEAQGPRYLKVEPKNVLPSGFQLIFYTSADAAVPNLRAHWLAHGYR